MSQELVGRIIRDVAELPDRNSPEGQPEMMLVTADELEHIIRHALAANPSQGVFVPVAALRDLLETSQERYEAGKLVGTLSDELWADINAAIKKSDPSQGVDDVLTPFASLLAADGTPRLIAEWNKAYAAITAALAHKAGGE